MKQKLFLFATALLFSVLSYAQTTGVAINTTGADAAASAILDVSSLTKGALVPRMTSTQRGAIVSPATGLLVFQTDSPEGFYYYNAASAWVYLTNSAGVLAIVNGGTGQTTKAAAFDALSPMTTQGDIIYGGTGGTGTRLAAGSSGQVLTSGGAGAPTWASAGSGWGLTGNAGTTPGTNFIGTTDDKALVFKVNNLKAGEVSSGTNTSFGYQTLLSVTGSGGNTAIGSLALKANTTGQYNTANGYKALESNVANSRSTAIGFQAMMYADDIYTGTKLTYNTAVGYEALRGSTTAANNTGTNNTAVGDQALYSNTTGSNNNANGFQALSSNTSGSYNIANGYQALYSNTAGWENIANGYQALYSNTTGNYNTANGSAALMSNTTGQNNTANGYMALCYTITGNNNTANGSKAGNFISGGSSQNFTSTTSVFLGALTKALAHSQSNEIVIGYDATGAGSNTATLGNTSITSTVLRGNVTAKRYVLTQPSAIASAATTTIDLSLGNVFEVTLGANISTLTLTNDAVGTYIVKFTQDATGGRTVAFPAAWKWSGGSAPTVTATLNTSDIVTLIYIGTTYYAAIVQNF